MKKYATFTTSTAFVDCQLTISNKIIEREKDVNRGEKIKDIVNQWLDKIHTEFKIGSWAVGIDKNDNIFIHFSGSDCHYFAEATQCAANVRIDLCRYEYKYTVKEVD